MTIYIDPPIWPGHGHLWSHMISDQSYEELHAFAARIGIPRRGFERDHYDVIAERYSVALAAGAQPFRHPVTRSTRTHASQGSRRWRRADAAIVSRGGGTSR